MKIGNKEFDLSSHCYIMGILNVTPDSFSDGGKFNTLDAALKHTEEMIRDGADIIDIGGESTRPGHVVISEEEEIARVTPVIEAVKSILIFRFQLIPYKGKVTLAGIAGGADLVNDIWGFKHDPEVAAYTAKYNAACCLMHNRQNPVGHHFMNTALEEMNETILLAKQAGIKDDRIVLDPGVGFGKTYEMNLEVIRNLSAFKRFGYPVLLGASRKSVIGLALDLPVDKREEGTLVTTAAAVFSGCSFVRVHDVEGNRRAVRMARSIMGAPEFK